MKNEFISIRDARIDELGEVSLLLKEAYIQYENMLPQEAWNYYLADIMNVGSRLDESQLVVAEVDRLLVGTITLYLDGLQFEQQGWPRDWARLRLLAVHPNYRGRGIGRALMEEVIWRCRKKSLRTVGLHTTEMMDVARRIYERIGFVRIPEFDFFPRPGVVVMAYKLDLKPQTG